MQKLFWVKCLLLIPSYGSVSKDTLQICSLSKLHAKYTSTFSSPCLPKLVLSFALRFRFNTWCKNKVAGECQRLPLKRVFLSCYLPSKPTLPSPTSVLPSRRKWNPSARASCCSSWWWLSPLTPCRHSACTFIDCIKQVRNKSKTNSNHSELPQNQ